MSLLVAGKGDFKYKHRPVHNQAKAHAHKHACIYSMIGEDEVRIAKNVKSSTAQTSQQVKWFAEICLQNE